jgi:hypothetical protein
MHRLLLNAIEMAHDVIGSAIEVHSAMSASVPCGASASLKMAIGRTC